MAVDKKFVLTGAKRVIDSRPMYAQVVVTDDCNLTCSYCDEYTHILAHHISDHLTNKRHHNTNRENRI